MSNIREYNLEQLVSIRVEDESVSDDHFYQPYKKRPWPFSDQKECVYKIGFLSNRPFLTWSVEEFSKYRCHRLEDKMVYENSYVRFYFTDKTTHTQYFTDQKERDRYLEKVKNILPVDLKDLTKAGEQS